MTATTTREPGPSAPGDPGSQPLLRLRGIGKEFFGNSVLRGIDLDVRAGEVHALVGENGAGKSTLMKIIAGVHRPDGGTMELDGAPASFPTPLAAQHAGVSTVFQEFNLLPERSVAENVYLGREPRRAGLVDRRRMLDDTTALLEDLGLGSITAWMRVGSLSVAQQQIVEIVKAVSYDARIISMDEPTAALADQEVELLYELVHRLKERGVAILYVSHRLKEIFDLCDTITVLKDGNHVLTTPTADIDPDGLVRTMVGREFSGYFPDKDPAIVPGDVRLSLEGVGNAQVDDVTIEVRAGEIVALAGLQGSGRTEIAHGIFGIAGFTRGRVLVEGRQVDVRSPRQAVRAGLALVTEDRKAEGLALGQSILANARLVLDAVLPGSSDRRARRIPGILSSLELVAASQETEVQFLSGGNQQKVVLAKWLVTDPKVIVLDEPTRGIDVGAKRAVYDLMRDLTREGVAVLFISSELPEVIAMADRILVMRDGRLAGELPTGSDEETVMALATGAGEESAEHVHVDLAALAEHSEHADHPTTPSRSHGPKEDR
ncbi:sugar ABC transporter ATP-binding protein [Cellulosimicrobium marinum]|uniref:sugar ABC transporter ATP-binding protein n=1 Tax=Cellulosimicrobium marinum TaxID=1638992 RepID=UPI001E451F4B|nr:sugar ABC transporter ATP-binding protein [Cellulosimicrobium marinum]MCB7137998.1 sugar ABC transporter ATP-binding protein [Cellulosimicrobium marinum]